MRRLAWLFSALVLCGFGPIYTDHDSQPKVDVEIKNLYDQAQGKQFRVVVATPNLMDLKDSEVVIMSTGAVVRLMFRSGQEIFSIPVTSVTVRR